MNITINGKITSACPMKTGVSKTGKEWASQDFVIETDNEEKICFSVFGADRIKESGLRVGATASVTCKIESREWQGRWFTSVSCVNCIVQGVTPQQQAQPKTQPITQPVDFGRSNSSEVSADTLPF